MTSVYKGLHVGGQIVTHCGPALKWLTIWWEGKIPSKQILQPVIETATRKNDKGHSQLRLVGQGDESFQSECSLEVSGVGEQFRQKDNTHTKVPGRGAVSGSCNYKHET